jgi:hypothetical protein
MTRLRYGAGRDEQRPVARRRARGRRRRCSRRALRHRRLIEQFARAATGARRRPRRAGRAHRARAAPSRPRRAAEPPASPTANTRAPRPDQARRARFERDCEGHGGQVRDTRCGRGPVVRLERQRTAAFPGGCGSRGSRLRDASSSSQAGISGMPETLACAFKAEADSCFAEAAEQTCEELSIVACSPLMEVDAARSARWSTDRSEPDERQRKNDESGSR